MEIHLASHPMLPPSESVLNVKVSISHFSVIIILFSQRSQLDRLALHDSKRSTYDHTRKCAETLVLLGQVRTLLVLTKL